MWNVTSKLAIVCFLAATPLVTVAQTTETQDETVEPQGEVQLSEGTDTSTDAVESDEAVAEADTPMEGAAPVEGKEVDGQIVMQGDNSVLANDLIGATVYSASGESVGDINDMIVNLDGSVEGAVIGVGGFLGLGEKNVAIEMDKLSVTMTSAATPQLTLSSTKEELEAAPDFVSARQQEVAAGMAVQQKEAMESLAQPPADGQAAPADNN